MNLKNLSESLKDNNWDDVANSGMVTSKEQKQQEPTSEQKPTDSNTGKQNMFENKKLMFD